MNSEHGWAGFEQCQLLVLSVSHVARIAFIYQCAASAGVFANASSVQMKPLKAMYHYRLLGASSLSAFRRALAAVHKAYLVIHCIPAQDDLSRLARRSAPKQTFGLLPLLRTIACDRERERRAGCRTLKSDTRSQTSDRHIGIVLIAFTLGCECWHRCFREQRERWRNSGKTRVY